MAGLVGALAAGFGPAKGTAASLRAAVSLALDFWTWRRLTAMGLSDEEAADVMIGAARAAAGRCVEWR